MRKSYDQKLKDLHFSLLEMGASVEKVIHLSIESLVKQDLEKAEEAIKLDNEVDRMELEIEEQCLELFALQNPLAGDLRKISSIMKIITDLERVGDYGVNIANITKKIGRQKLIKPLVDIPKMAEITKTMVIKSLDSFVKEDKELAIEVAEMDDLVDELYDSICVELLKMVGENKEIIEQVVNLLFIGRYLERIADHTTNICERIIYILTGERVYF
ncbi:phosphate-specific transport system accessory protein PhoU [Gottschalkia purinilytica]|uniref:Phosphate-specific transport system accessory protein PhoU n=1 Tax=Gottschalkia purinilytica TaxID=1503 RepID=A0A0L0WER9_GOTPU|nr:phosphate signaling complex protein PhoU [Gottschalkia purinilytica]KNF09935.1 phosphate-specific transport system accessory protein PhoU [Gottschalkia purinilytica]